MKVKLLQSIAGNGDFVQGFQIRFALDAGALAEVEDSVGRRWCAAGIAEPEKAPIREREAAQLKTPPETATLPKPIAKSRQGVR